jgi:hypothetical protein
MSKKIMKITFLSVFVIFVDMSNATIIVSGDATFVNFLSPTFCSHPDLGTQQFFANVMQGVDGVGILGQLGKKTNRQVEILNSYYSLKSPIIEHSIEFLNDEILNNIQMLLVPIPAYSFSGNELVALSDYIQTGGSVFFMGDNAGYSGNNNVINQTLSSIGSSLRIVDNTLDPRLDTAVGRQIAADDYTDQVRSLRYYSVSEVRGGQGMSGLFYSNNGIPFIAYEQNQANVPEPSVEAQMILGLSALFFLVRIRKPRRVNNGVLQ